VVDEVHIAVDRVTFVSRGGRRWRLTAAAVLVAGGVTQAGLGAVSREPALLVAGLVGVAFGISIARHATRAGTTVTAEGWTDPTRVRHQWVPWTSLARVRITAVGARASISLERHDVPSGSGVRVARLPRRAVPAVRAAIAPWAATTDTQVLDATGTRRPPAGRSGR
jgi:hypothetical protein